MVVNFACSHPAELRGAEALVGFPRDAAGVLDSQTCAAYSLAMGEP